MSRVLDDRGEACEEFEGFKEFELLG
jgi:hypothetical protein